MIPEIIWTYWNDIELPEFISNCIETWRFHNPYHIINILNENNFTNFCKYDIKSHKHYDKSKPAFMSDMIRLDLLKNYGGIWMDASIICLKPLKFKKDTKCFMYYKNNTNGLIYQKFPILESWFIACSKNNKFISSWHSEFIFKMENYETLSSYKQSNNDGLLREWKSTYFVVYSAVQSVLNKYYLDGENPEIILKNAVKDGPYKHQIYIHVGLLFDANKCKEIFNTTSPMIKFTSNHRKIIEKCDVSSWFDNLFKKEHMDNTLYMEDIGNNDGLVNGDYPYTHIDNTIKVSFIWSIFIFLIILICISIILSRN